MTGHWARDLGDLEWQNDAACAAAVRQGTARPEFWFPSRAEWDTPQTWRALAICSTCPVQANCLEFTMTHRAETAFGIWAGTSERARRLLQNPEEDLDREAVA